MLQHNVPRNHVEKVFDGERPADHKRSPCIKLHSLMIETLHAPSYGSTKSKERQLER